MKKHISIIFIILFINSCDVVEGPYYSPADSYINPDKKILIEDFTGHTCPNCPEAAKELEAIQSLYGDQIVGMAIHVSTTFARPYAPTAPFFQYDFRTEWGDNWDSFYGISSVGLPKGMINRIGMPDNNILGKDQWAAIVAQELKKDINFKIYIESDESSISINSEIYNTHNGNYNLRICLTENNVVNWQKDGSDNVENYNHKHVLRSVILDEPLSNSTNYTIGDQINKTINYNLSELESANIQYSENVAEMGNGNAGDWDYSNISVVAYIYDTNTQEIVQVEEAHLNN